MLKINVDCDGVLADFVNDLCDDLDQYLEVGLKKPKIDRSKLTDWHIQDEIIRQTSIDLDTISALVREPNFCFGMSVLPGAKEFVEQLLALPSTRVNVITTPYDSYHWMPEREAWLKKYLGINREQVVFSHNKADFYGNFFIDDKVSAVIEWVKARRTFGHQYECFGFVWLTDQNKNEVFKNSQELKDFSIAVAGDFDTLLARIKRIGRRIDGIERLAA